MEESSFATTKISYGSFKTMSKITLILCAKIFVLDLSHFLLKAIVKKGYKQPTPIQRKTLPLFREGKDIVAMARTGSGKTGAYVIPMIDKLKIHSLKVLIFV